MKLITLLSIFLSQNITISPKYIYLGGDNILFGLKSNELTITGTYDILINNSNYNPGRDEDIRIGDVILSINNQKIYGIEDFISKLRKTNNNYATLEINRNKEVLQRKIILSIDRGIYKTGLYVKDKILGSGTLSFIDPDSLYYGALGHAVFDSDTKDIVNFSIGESYYSSVQNIIKGKKGKPGEKNCTLDFNNVIGNVLYNTRLGIFGKANSIDKNRKKIEIASKNNIKKGKAYIFTSIEGNKVDEFDINITNLEKQDMNGEKGISFEITNKRMIEECGGIISGMSGSPIIQDNKMIGVVTHVISNEITKGYGLYIENMINNLNKSIN